MHEGATSRFWRLSGEFVVIVMGVLTALGVDQWMEGRRERDLERELLQSLIEDLRPRGIRVVSAIEGLGRYSAELPDPQLVGAFAAVGIPTDLDVASGAYRQFASAGGQRLVRNQGLRGAIHAYYAAVESNLKFDPRVRNGMRDLEQGSLELGLHHGDNQGSMIRERLGLAGPRYFAALRRVQQDAIVQGDIADLLLGRGSTLLAELRAELQ